MQILQSLQFAGFESIFLASRGKTPHCEFSPRAVTHSTPKSENNPNTTWGMRHHVSPLCHPVFRSKSRKRPTKRGSGDAGDAFDAVFRITLLKSQTVFLSLWSSRFLIHLCHPYPLKIKGMNSMSYRDSESKTATCDLRATRKQGVVAKRPPPSWKVRIEGLFESFVASECVEGPVVRGLSAEMEAALEAWCLSRVEPVMLSPHYLRHFRRWLTGRGHLPQSGSCGPYRLRIGLSESSRFKVLAP